MTALFVEWFFIAKNYWFIIEIIYEVIFIIELLTLALLAKALLILFVCWLMYWVFTNLYKTYKSYDRETGEWERPWEMTDEEKTASREAAKRNLEFLKEMERLKGNIRYTYFDDTNRGSKMNIVCKNGDRYEGVFTEYTGGRSGSWVVLTTDITTDKEPNTILIKFDDIMTVEMLTTNRKED